MAAVLVAVLGASAVCTPDSGEKLWQKATDELWSIAEGMVPEQVKSDELMEKLATAVKPSVMDGFRALDPKVADKLAKCILQVTSEAKSGGSLKDALLNKCKVIGDNAIKDLIDKFQSSILPKVKDMALDQLKDLF